jgi:anti-anti-sigma factor
MPPRWPVAGKNSRVGAESMENPAAHFRWSLEDGVAVVEILSRELNQPRFAQELGVQLGALLDARPSDRILLNFHKTKYMSSTSFATLLNFAKAVEAVGAKLAICAMDRDVRVGADILSLGQFIPIFDDEASAIAALRSPFV